jgi:hypothetical protein
MQSTFRPNNIRYIFVHFSSSVCGLDSGPISWPYEFGPVLGPLLTISKGLFLGPAGYFSVWSELCYVCRE